MNSLDVLELPPAESYVLRGTTLTADGETLH